MNTFSDVEQTRFFKSHYGIEGETRVKIAGKCWDITTSKGGSGVISTHCHAVTDEGNGATSFVMFGQDEGASFHVNILPKGTRATEKTIREAHAEGLKQFYAKSAAGELPKADAEIQIGQIIFSDYIQRSETNRRAVYEINGSKFKTVLLDGSRTQHDDHVRPYAKRFGIGTYYNEGEKISQEKIDALLIQARDNMKVQAAKDEIEREEAAQKEQEKKAYLSQFTRADRRKSTAIIKAHILKAFPSVSKVEVKSDHNSMYVTYYAPSKIEELETFIDEFKMGHFNGMDDIYEYAKDKEEIILEDHILELYQYVSVSHKEAEEPAADQVKEALPVQPIQPGKVQIIDYSEKAIAVIGDTKPIKDKLKELGGRFNFRLTCGPGWIFRKADLERIKQALSVKEVANV